MFGRSTKKSLRHWTRAGVLWLVVLAFVFSPASVGVKAAGDGEDDGGFRHVFVIMMENTGFDALIGNPNAPFTNYLAATAGLATNYFGVTHPSQPNYIAATSGSTNGVPNDNDITINVPNIVDQLESHNKTWKAYMQSFSLCNGNVLAHACGNQLYERKHNPFVSYQDWTTSRTSALSRLIWRTTPCPIIPGSALTNATTCTAAAVVVQPTPATSPKFSPSLRQATCSCQKQSAPSSIPRLGAGIP